MKKHKISTLTRRPNLNYIAFIKFWAMILIIKWHIFIWETKPIDYGARMCEILFISSGFLVGYNYYKREMEETFTNAFKYTYKHIRTFYPLDLINVMYAIYRYNKKFDKTDIESLILNISLLKSWSRYINSVRCFSRISWFLSSLLFCYFCTPFLLKGIKTIKSSLLLFVTVAFIRIVIEEYIRKGKEAINILDLDFHRGPGIRCMEFFLGMLTIPTFFKIKKILEPLRNNFLIKVLFTIIQLVSPLIIYNLMLKYDQILLRCHFVLIFCFFIFIFGYDYGYLSDILSSKSCKLIMSCQMEMYLLQRTVNTILIIVLLSFCKNIVLI